MAAHLRVYPRSFDESYSEPAPTINVRLGDLLPLLSMAKRNNHIWLQDFLDDEVSVSPDLYEVLRAFSTVRRPSA